MTIQEAVRQTQGKDAGIVNRLSVRYAETLLLHGEEPSAAVIANITVGREQFPGVVVLTDRRMIAVCGLPGIKRAAACGPRWSCLEDPSAIRHKFMVSDGKQSFSMTVDPDTGERFSRYIAQILGEEGDFDAAAENSGGILNPVLSHSKRRARQANEKRMAEVARFLEESSTKEHETAEENPK